MYRGFLIDFVILKHKIKLGVFIFNQKSREMEVIKQVCSFIIASVSFYFFLQRGYEIVDKMAGLYGFFGKIIGICVVGLFFKIYFYITEDF